MAKLLELDPIVDYIPRGINRPFWDFERPLDTKFEADTQTFLRIVPELPMMAQNQRVWNNVTELMKKPDDTADSNPRYNTLQLLTHLVTKLSTRGLLKSRRFGDEIFTNTQEDDPYGILIKGASPMHIYLGDTTDLIKRGILRSEIKIAAVTARKAAKISRGAYEANTGMFIALDQPERIQLIRDFPSLAEQIKMTGVEEDLIADGDRKITPAAEAPVIGIRESYTFTVPVHDRKLLPDSFLKQLGVTRKGLEGLEIDVAGVYVLANQPDGNVQLFYLGENHIPHFHHLEFDQYTRVEIARNDLHMREIVNAIKKHLGIKNPSDKKDNFYATNQQLASLTTLVLGSAKTLQKIKVNP